MSTNLFAGFKGAFKNLFLFALLISIAICQTLSAQTLGGFNSNESVPSEVKPSELSAGAVSDNVNHFNGDLSISQSLGSVSAPAGMSFDLMMTNNPNVVIGASSSLVNGVPYGEGWNLSLPSISVSSEIYNSFGLYT